VGVETFAAISRVSDASKMGQFIIGDQGGPACFQNIEISLPS
jgi:hypothetical protein